MSQNINLSSISTLPAEYITKEEAAVENEKLTTELSEIQDKLFAQNKYAALIILQGLDTSGKDSAVKHVFSGVNPAGCNVRSFKVPTIKESSHHFLWRISKECPQKGMIKIFNRSHYEDILIPTVTNLLKEEELKERSDEINMFERGLIKDNTILFKFFLHVSHDEQLKRLNERRTDPNKNWKFNKEDILDIARHNKLKKAYEYIFENCSETTPWKIIPADKKWYKNYSILSEIVKTLSKYKIEYPDLKREKKK